LKTMSEEKSNIPKVFISYSWSSPEHESWVMQLAERLISDGVEVILDKWDLREGQDNTSFMEQMVTDENVTKVLAICDGKYADKANERNKKSSGVGIEAQIISREVYEKTTQTKFIPVIAEYNESGKAYTPVFFKSRFYIDMSTEDKYLENYEQLLRAIYDKPIHVKPKLGKPPTYILEPSIPASSTFHKLEMFKQAVLSDKKTANGLLKDYLLKITEFKLMDRFLMNLTNK
jgi:TIR domain